MKHWDREAEQCQALYTIKNGGWGLFPFVVDGRQPAQYISVETRSPRPD